MYQATLGNLALDTDPYRLLSIDFNAPPTEIHEVTTALADKNVQADVRTSAYRDIVVSVAVSQAKKQDLITQVKVLTDELAKSANTLTVQPDVIPGQSGDTTYPVVFTIGRNPEPEITFDQGFEAGCVAHVTFVLKAEPYSYRDSAQQATAPQISAPDFSTFTNLGERPLPIDLTVQNGDTGHPLTALYAAVIPEPNTVTIGSYYRQCALSSPFACESSYFTAVGPVGWGPTASVKFAPTDATARYLIWTMDPALPDGRYRVLLRAYVSNSAAPATIQLKDGSPAAATLAAAPYIAQKTLSSTAWQLLDFGEVDVPQRGVRSGGSGSRALAFLTSLATFTGNFVYFDAVVLVPATSLVRFCPTDGSQITGVFRISDQGAVYRDDYVSYAGVTGQALRLAQSSAAQKILVVADNTACAGKSNLTLTVSHQPRYVQWRSA